MNQQLIKWWLRIANWSLQTSEYLKVNQQCMTLKSSWFSIHTYSCWTLGYATVNFVQKTGWVSWFTKWIGRGQNWYIFRLAGMIFSTLWQLKLLNRSVAINSLICSNHPHLNHFWSSRNSSVTASHPSIIQIFIVHMIILKNHHHLMRATTSDDGNHHLVIAHFNCIFILQ